VFRVPIVVITAFFFHPTTAVAGPLQAAKAAFRGAEAFGFSLARTLALPAGPAVRGGSKGRDDHGLNNTKQGESI